MIAMKKRRGRVPKQTSAQFGEKAKLRRYAMEPV
jgi:hypothetical protein